MLMSTVRPSSLASQLLQGFFPGKKKRCTDQAHRKAVEHTTKCWVKADQSSSARASAVHS
jgi:hypothetical protein